MLQNMFLRKGEIIMAELESVIECADVCSEQCS